MDIENLFPCHSKASRKSPKKVKQTKNKKVNSVEEHLPSSFDFFITHASYSGKLRPQATLLIVLYSTKPSRSCFYCLSNIIS